MSFDESKPVQNGLLISADHRANFLATRNALHSINLLQDPTFECWHDSDTVAPGTWQHTPGGGSILRDTTLSRLAVGSMGPRLTFGATTNELFQDILDAASYDDFFDARVVTALLFVHSDTIGNTKLRIDDGAATTDSAANLAANPTDPEILVVEHVVNAAATRLRFAARLESAGNVTLSGAVFVFGDIRPNRFVWPGIIRSSLIARRNGEIFTGFVDRHIPQRAFIVDQVQLDMEVAPTGADAIADVLQFDGAVHTSLFSGGGRPTISAGAFDGGSEPDGTYNRKCFVPKFGSGAVTVGQRIRAEINQVGSIILGEDMKIYIRYRTWARPQELLAVPGMVF